MTREEKIAAIKKYRESSGMTREEKIALINESRAPIRTPETEKEKLPPPQVNVMGPMQGLLESAPVIGEYYKMPRIAAESALSSMSMGLSDPLLAGLEAGGQYASKYATEFGKSLSGNKPNYPSLAEEYKKSSEIKKLEREQNPLSAAAGSVAGAVSPVGAPVKIAGYLGKGIKGAGLLSKLGRSAVTAGTGIATDTAEENIKAAAGTMDKSMAVPMETKLKYGGIAALSGPVAEGLSSGIGKLSSKMKGESIAMKLKQAGAIQKDFKKLRPGEKEALFDTMKKYGIANPGDTFDDVLTKTDKLKEEAGQGISEIYDNYNKKINDPNFIRALPPKEAANFTERMQKVTLNPDVLADDILKDISKETLGGASGREVSKTVKKELLNLKDAGLFAKESGESNMNALLKYRRSLDDKLKNVWQKLPKERTLQDDALVEIRKKVQNRIDDHLDELDKMFGTKELKELKQRNKLYAQMSKVNDLANQGVARVEGNRVFGLTEGLMGSAGFAGGMASSQDKDFDSIMKSAILGLGAAGAGRIGRTYGPGFASPVLEKGSKVPQYLSDFIIQSQPGLIAPKLAPKDGRKNEGNK